ncbi:MAG: primase protein [Candidatus Nomurabacteria bacterium GW2011_GWE1_32_28]|uniref:DNA primase n=1 Tax=Candidatus Nomurabacteria bacterium GW2011_GWF1_31_48 TaxID=1618767 RepID=A0A0F9YUN7_9BACT|nr:MAG: primase protein [Candidatus Nomurabacteria bacterium GW2011_GWF2_30_133]KKP28610.1 MAG: primase protein [Candidatus Nomurabacteria bacterium GW2011_GWE2_31_40]KKP30186.1 MAG: primase protein [Candidatus Nomurabacteria bacterium GW2011_GWF1_31_48]KKP34712.1 MAG: primase protein [Candidatus Nomurabacteria bacterium GW2011_GWE1_32_28]HAS80829.1 DNA primase [Candidatus Nomurabacteria bacterium]
MNSPVQQIKERLSIEEVVSSYIKLERSGVNFKARCPFHNEKTPSFFISTERNNYYCFGCGAKGDIFTFVQEFEGLDFKSTLKILAEKAGVVLSEFNKEKEGEKDKLYRIIEEATRFFEKNLIVESDVLEYLKSRGLHEKTIKDFRIGFIKNDWHLLHSYLSNLGFSNIEMEKAGLVKKTDKGFYDRFRARIIFPIADSSGRIIAFSGRIFVDDGKSAKYLNSPETPIFNKSSVLFGIDKAKDSIRKNNFSILVEGQMDLILSHQAGFKNTVASSGTAMTDSLVSKENIINNLGLITRLSKNIVLAYDADKAGISASNRFAKIALYLGMDVKVASMPEGMDPADLISKVGVDSWRLAIKNSKHFIEFMLDRILSNISDNRKTDKEIRERLLPFINDIESSIEKSRFIQLISSKSSIATSDLIEDLKKVELALKYEKEEIKIAKENVEKKLRKDPIERKLFGIAFWQESVKNRKIDPELIFKKLVKVYEKYQNIKEDLVSEAEEFYSNNENLQKDVDEMLLNIEEEYLKEELSKNMVDLYNIKGKEGEIEILKKVDEINKKIQGIKNGRLKNKPQV